MLKARGLSLNGKMIRECLKRFTLLTTGILSLTVSGQSIGSEEKRTSRRLERIQVSPDGKGFVTESTGERFRIWGVNYDHDRNGRLIDEYWDEEWETVEEDFAEIKALGANCVRIHLQFGLFMDSATVANEQALARLAQLLRLAERLQLYLDVTGLACYHKKNIPVWYDALTEAERWRAQAVFWEAVARVCSSSPAVFCYDLMNEPVVAGKQPASDWLLGELGGHFFTQRIALDLKGRTRKEIARAWVEQMAAAIRKHDQEHLVTVGVIPWVFVFGGGRPPFYDPQVGASLDFVSGHFYPEAGKTPKAIKALKAYEIGKPLVVEEFFPLKCGIEELLQFVNEASDRVDGWMSFYWGQTADELRRIENPSLAESITRSWLEAFQIEGVNRAE